MPELHTGVISHSAFSLSSQYILKSNLLNHIFVVFPFCCLSAKARQLYEKFVRKAQTMRTFALLIPHKFLKQKNKSLQTVQF